MKMTVTRLTAYSESIGSQLHLYVRYLKTPLRAQICPPIRHRFRDMMEAELTKLDPSFAEYKAISQSFGHKSVMTTLTSYGSLSLSEQGKLIRESLKQRYNNVHS